MSDDNEEFNFEHLDNEMQHSVEIIAFEEIAKGVAPLYLALRKQGLSESEAAHLATTFLAGMLRGIVPPPTQPPHED